MTEQEQKAGFFARMFKFGRNTQPERIEPQIADIPEPQQPLPMPESPAPGPAEAPFPPPVDPVPAPPPADLPTPAEPQPAAPPPDETPPPADPTPVEAPPSPEPDIPAPEQPEPVPEPTTPPPAPAELPEPSPMEMPAPDVPAEAPFPSGAAQETAESAYSTHDDDAASAPQPLQLSDVMPTAAPSVEKRTWWRRLKDGLSRSSSAITSGITGIVLKRKLDAATLEDIEDVLIQADLGIDVSSRISSAIAKGRYDRHVTPEEVSSVLASEVEAILTPVALPLEINPARKPFVILMVGVNGAGKTTTIGKLAAKFSGQGKRVMLAAGDTFRAAAIEQLKVWADRTHSPIITREQGADAAGLAFDAMKGATENGSDILLIDTAGRLQNKALLMDELAKIVRVIRKVDTTAPHAVLLVLDATVGQNAVSQVDLFGKTAGVTGLVMTKLDGTARGGILVALAAKYGLPVHFIGVGEGIDDLEPFSAKDFSRAIAGLE